MQLFFVTHLVTCWEQQHMIWPSKEVDTHLELWQPTAVVQWQPLWEVQWPGLVEEMVPAPWAHLMALSLCVKVCSVYTYRWLGKVCVCAFVHACMSACVLRKWGDCLTVVITHLPEFVCTDLPDPANGRVTFSSGTVTPFSLTTMATYRCDQGYGLNGGSSVRTCGANVDITNPKGVWNGTAPTCEG